MPSPTGALDRSRPPRPGAPGSFRFPEFERARLACGLELLAIRTGNLPLAHMRLLAPAGGQLAPTDTPGLPSFTAGLMDEGTAKRSGPELAAAVERLGGYLGTGAGWDAAVIEAEVLARDFVIGLTLIAEVAREASFPEHEVGRVRRQLLAEIARRRAEPSAVASEHFQRALYAGTVYADPLIGTEDSLERQERSTVVAFHERHFRPEGATLVVVGDLAFDALLRTAESVFAGWTGQAAEAPAIRPQPLAERRFEIVDRPGAAQTEIRVGHSGIARDHPRFVTAQFLSSLFGGKFTSRLNLNLRETHGFTYGVKSRFGRRLGPAPFVISTALANEHVGAALSEIFTEVDRIRAEPPTDEEVADTRDYLIGSFPYSIETQRGLAGRLTSLAIYDLGEEYYSEYPRIVAGITGDDLLATARELLLPDRSLVVCVGPAEELRPQLEERFEEPISVVSA